MRLRFLCALILTFATFLSFAQSSGNQYYKAVNIPKSELLTWLQRSSNLKQNITLSLTQSLSDQLGKTHQKYIQYYNGIPILNSEIIAHCSSEMVESINGCVVQSNAILPPKQSNFTAKEAIEIAKKYVHATVYKWESDTSYLPTCEYFYIKKNIFSTAQVYRLAYKVNIYAEKPLYRAYLYIDALDGSILLEDKIIKHIDVSTNVNTAYSGTQTITTNSSNGTFYLQANNIGGGISTYDCHNGTSYLSATIPTSANNTWIYSGKINKAILDVHWGTIQTYNYYKNIHNRNSYDNANAQLKSYVHYDYDFVNAFWDGSKMTYGDGDGISYTALTSIDVVGHELTHAVTEHSANLIYQGESGALNESFSDIMGSAVEYYAKPGSFSWQLGNEFSLIGQPFRDMSNPNAQQNPDTYQGNYWDPNEEVHTNSGVQNYWYYLVTNGGNGTNDNGDSYSVTGIGFTKSAAIAYRTLTVYLTSNATYDDARTYSIMAAEDLYGACSAEVQAVTAAWYAVGIGNNYSNAITADFSSASTFVCAAPATIQFKNLSTNASSYTWDFGDSSPTSNSKNPSHTYSAPGNFTVTLTASGNIACGAANTKVKTNYITVANSSGPANATCTPTNTLDANFGTVQFDFNTISNSSSASDAGYEDFTCTQSTTTLEGSAVNFSVIDEYTLEKIDVAMWLDFNNNGSFSNSEKIYAASSQNHNGKIIIPKGSVYNTPLRLRVISDYNNTITSSCYNSYYGQTEDYTVILQQNNLAPKADFKANAVYITPGTTVQFSDQSLNIPTSWNWTFSGANINNSTLQNPSATYNSYGSYNVKLKVANNNGSDSTTKSLYIHVIDFDKLCVNTSSTDSSGVLYDEGGALYDYSTDKTCTFLISPGCRDSIIIDVDFLDVEKNFDYLNIYDGPNTNSVNIYQETGKQTIKKQVIATSGTATIELTSDQYVTGAGFQLSWRSTSLKSSDSIQVSTGPYYANSPIDFSFSGNADTYSWNFGDNKFSSVAAPTISYKNAGTYNIQLSTTSATSCSQFITKIITVLADTNPVLNLGAFPNPTTGEFTLTIPKNTGTESIEIYSSLGELMYKINPAVSEGRTLKMHIDALANAVYFVTFISNEEPQTIPVVISK